jgi:hypothetical protein
MVDSEGGVHFERQGLLPPRSLIRVKATALLCSLNILALPAQDEPTCICGRGCLVKPRPVLQSFCTCGQSAEPHSKGRMPMWKRTSTASMKLPVF